jgi:hypothetical protein
VAVIAHCDLGCGRRAAKDGRPHTAAAVLVELPSPPCSPTCSSSSSAARSHTSVAALPGNTICSQRHRGIAAPGLFPVNSATISSAQGEQRNVCTQGAEGAMTTFDVRMLLPFMAGSWQLSAPATVWGTSFRLSSPTVAAQSGTVEVASPGQTTLNLCAKRATWRSGRGPRQPRGPTASRRLRHPDRRMHPGHRDRSGHRPCEWSG